MSQKIQNQQQQLLKWFAKHQRIMPWRAVKGEKANPYHVWLSEIMLQQTTVATVGPYFQKFIKRWPTIKALAAASQDTVLTEWAGLGYYARARNLHKCAKVIVDDYDGKIPSAMEVLLSLPGIGPYTAAAIHSIAFNQPAAAVDGNVERVLTRLYNIQEPLPLSKPQIKARADKLAANNPAPSQFTQGLMELGSLICTPRAPKCDLCPWQKDCIAHKKDIAETLPKKIAKKKKPIKYGKVYLLQNKQGHIALQRRGDTGLYAGMYQLPTTEWLEDKKAATVLRYSSIAGVRDKKLTLRHSFTHFDLVLSLWQGENVSKTSAKGFIFVPPHKIKDYALPTLMQKALKLYLSA